VSYKVLQTVCFSGMRGGQFWFYASQIFTSVEAIPVPEPCIWHLLCNSGSGRNQSRTPLLTRHLGQGSQSRQRLYRKVGNHLSHFIASLVALETSLGAGGGMRRFAAVELPHLSPTEPHPSFPKHRMTARQAFWVLSGDLPVQRLVHLFGRVCRLRSWSGVIFADRSVIKTLSESEIGCRS